MTEQKELSWDDALGTCFVKFKSGVKKFLGLTNWNLVAKEFTSTTGVKETKVALVADVFREDGRPVAKKLSVTSTRLKAAFKPVLEKYARNDPTVKVFVGVKMIGEDFATQYDIENASE